MINKNPEKIKQMFDNLASNYDTINNILSFFTHKIVKKDAICALEIKNNSKVLDLCCGSGDLGRIIKDLNKTAEVVGVDFSPSMIEIAKNKNKDITYFTDDALNLSFGDNTYDYVVAGFGLRNIQDFDRVIKEIYRVLKPNGCLLHLDFGKKSFISGVYDKIALFLIGLYKKDKAPFEYLIESKNLYYEPIELIEKFKTYGFSYVKHKNSLFNIISFQIMSKKSPSQ